MDDEEIRHLGGWLGLGPAARQLARAPVGVGG